MTAGRCGRLTKAGMPCKLPSLRLGGWYTILRYEAASCYPHATAAERAIYDAAKAAIEADEEQRMVAFHQSLPIACWSWPVTEDDRRRAAEARACDDPDQSRPLAWNLLADWQDDRCAVCKGRSEVLDHDHETGLVRGWLCRFCNAEEGHGYIPGGRYERYRVKNPASILGLTIRYYSPFTGWAEPEPPPGGLDGHAAYVLGTRYGVRRDG